MPAGGTWTVQNKVRPGAYINFVAVPGTSTILGERGTVAIGLPMTWGPQNEIIRLTGEELMKGESLAKVGVTVKDIEESLPYRVALAGCFEALLYRTDVGGTKAEVTIQENTLTVAAKYNGTTGNNITIVTVKDKPRAGVTTVEVRVNNMVKESFAITKLSDLSSVESAFVEFRVSNPSGQIPITAGAALTGGTNGEVDKTTYPNFWNLLDTQNFQCLAMYDNDSSVAPLIKERVELWREKRGKKVQAVVYNYTEADYEGIISVHQGFKTATETVDTVMFPLWVASMTAGAAVNQSLTAAVVNGAVEIINPVLEDEIESALLAGKFILTYRQDGAVCVEKDINCLCTYTDDKTYAFSKNRVVRCLDEIGNTVALIFNRNYAGQVHNDEEGRDLFKTEIIKLMDNLTGISAIRDFNSERDLVVLPSDSIDSVIVDLTVQPVDSMEKLYMTVNINT